MEGPHLFMTIIISVIKILESEDYILNATTYGQLVEKKKREGK